MNISVEGRRVVYLFTLALGAVLGVLIALKPYILFLVTFALGLLLHHVLQRCFRERGEVLHDEHDYFVIYKAAYIALMTVLVILSPGIAVVIILKDLGLIVLTTEQKLVLLTLAVLVSIQVLAYTISNLILRRLHG